ncbi:DUF4405 domain-containing protein [Alloyangia pacifica]|uniref:DUF4405 domain-containing protein n=1 Tax=Alloyangia pacifica TaxID=311180 RepID=UPI001CFD09A0|nr:DUF4405 domain-containing protein [Alloyangia pacifica]
MKSLLNRYATPFITGLFLVSLISGLALFFHWNAGWFHGMHEWLSLVLILPFVLHLWKNWRPMSSYMRKPAFALAMGASLVMAAAFVVPSLSAEPGARRGGPPQFAAAQLLLKGSVAEVAALVDLPADRIADGLLQAGFTMDAEGESLSAIAQASGRDEAELLAALVSAAR